MFWDIHPPVPTGVGPPISTVHGRVQRSQGEGGGQAFVLEKVHDLVGRVYLQCLL